MDQWTFFWKQWTASGEGEKGEWLFLGPLLIMQMKNIFWEKNDTFSEKHLFFQFSI